MEQVKATATASTRMEDKKLEPELEELRPGDQGMWYGGDNTHWPVTILPNDLVPDTIRQGPLQGVVPVLLLAKMDIEYVDASSIQKHSIEEFSDLLQEDTIAEQNPLFSALCIALEERSPIQWLSDIRKEWGQVTTDFDVEWEMQTERTLAKMGSQGTTNSAKRGREDYDEVSGNESASSRTKRQKSDSTASSDTAIDHESRTDPPNELSNAMLEIDPIYRGKWTAKEDAELIRLRERDMPNASWEDIIYAFYQRFDNSPRSRGAIRKRYSDYLDPDAIGVATTSSITHCIRLRMAALELLEHSPHKVEAASNTNRNSFIKGDKKEFKTSIGLDEDDHKRSCRIWTPAEDAELLRLKEHSGTLSMRQIRDHFQKKLPFSGRSLIKLRNRYNHYLQEDAFLTSGVATDQEDCDEARAIALSLLEDPRIPRHGGPESETKSPSIKEQRSSNSQKSRCHCCSARTRAEVVCGAGCSPSLFTRESSAAAVSHRAAAQRGIPGFHRSPSAIKHRYNDYLQPEAWFKGNAANKSTCDELRRRATRLQGFINSSIYDDVEDADASSQSSLPSADASGGTSIPDVSDMRIGEGSDLETDRIPEHPDFASGSARKWTAEEDANLLHLCETSCKDAPWKRRSQVWDKVMRRCPRTPSALQSRYNYFLVNGAVGSKNSGLDEKDCQQMRDRALAFLLERGENKAFQTVSDAFQEEFSRNWSAKEDSILIHLREDVVKRPEWQRITRLLKKRLPSSNRGSSALRKRYGTYLAPNAFGDRALDSEDCLRLRDRAQAYLRNFPARVDSVESSDDESQDSRAGTPWTEAEDAELIRLKERIGYELAWPAICQAFKSRFPSGHRSLNGTRERYGKVLAEDADASYCAAKRQGALRRLDRANAKHKQTASQLPIISLLSDDENDQAQKPVRQSDYDDNADDDDDDAGSDSENDDDNDEEDTDNDDSHEYQAERTKHMARSPCEGDDDDETLDEGASDNEIEGDSITFLIGKEQQRFRVPVSRTLSNSYILEDTVQDSNLGAIVTGNRWTRLKPEIFRPVYEYLKYGDYRPRIEDAGLASLRNDPAHHAREVVRCGAIFTLARDLQINELMGLVCCKLGFLNKQPLSVLMVVRAVYKSEPDGTENDILMRKILTDEVAENYHAYIEEQAKNLVAQMSKAPEFERDIARKRLSRLEAKASDADWEVL